MKSGLLILGALVAIGGVAIYAGTANASASTPLTPEQERVEAQARLSDWNGWDVATGGGIISPIDRQLITAGMAALGMGEAVARLQAESRTAAQSSDAAVQIVRTYPNAKLAPFIQALINGTIRGTLIPDPVASYPCTSCQGAA